MSTVKVIWDGAAWRGPGLAPSVPGSASFAPGSEPWRLRAGESILDNMPTSATVVQVGDISPSRNLITILNTADSITSPSGPIYIQLGEGDYTIDTLNNYGTESNPSWFGYANSNRKVMGLIGVGMSSSGDHLTKVVTSPTMVSSSAGARNYVLNTTGAAGPVPLRALYFSASGSAAAPLFFSGIEFQGTIQTPAGVYSSGSQSHFRRNQSAASPLPWAGIAVWRSQPGSRIQFCKFTGFGFTLNSAPPFECAPLDTNYSNGLTGYAVEIDGRIAARHTGTRPRASGGWMDNKELDLKLSRMWIHHTRRSGMASNTNTNNTSEKYSFTDTVFESIADGGDDGWASDDGQFNGFNIEEVIGTFTIENAKLNIAGNHIHWATPPSNANGALVLPGRVVIKVKNFSTDDTLYGGCLRLRTSRNPNSAGISPIWAAINNNMSEACATYFDFRNAAGAPMNPVRRSQFNAAIHKPDSHYVLIDF